MVTRSPAKTGAKAPTAAHLRVEALQAQRIRMGVGGWTYELWRANF